MTCHWPWWTPRKDAELAYNLPCCVHVSMQLLTLSYSATAHSMPLPMFSSFEAIKMRRSHVLDRFSCQDARHLIKSEKATPRTLNARTSHVIMIMFTSLMLYRWQDLVLSRRRIFICIIIIIAVITINMMSRLIDGSKPVEKYVEFSNFSWLLREAKAPEWDKTSLLFRLGSPIPKVHYSDKSYS